MDGGTSVYYRARALGPIFPWLLFFGLSSSAAEVTTAARATDYVVEGHPSSLFLRGGGGSSAPDRSKHRQRWSPSSHKRRRTQAAVESSSRTLQNYCGKTWTEANDSCQRPCPQCVSDWGSACDACDEGEQCFADLTSCPSLTIAGGQAQGQRDGGLMIDMGGGVTIWDTDGQPDDVLGGWGATGMLTTPPAPAPPIATVTTTPPPDPLVDMGIDISSSTSVTLPFQQGVSIPSTCPSTTTNIVNVGYYQSWAKYRTPACHPLQPADIPVSTFGYTHLIYSFADIHPDTGELRPYNGVTDEETLYAEFNSLKTGSSSSSANGLLLRTSIAVGGWNMDQALFVRISSSEESRLLFAKSVVTFVVRHDFDGIDFDWEYPAMPDRRGTPDDYTNYPKLVQAVREALADETLTSGKEYLVTMAIPISPDKLDTGYDFITLSKYVDWFHIMSYDVHGSWEDISGSNTDMSYISDAIENHILAKGVTGDQLVFGMASYGRSMKLTDPTSCMTIDCPISGPGMAGCSGEEGFSPYFELKESYVDTGNYESLLLNEHTSSMEMILDGGIFVSFDLVDTFQLKRDYYISKCFRGQMWWAIDMIKDPPFGSAQVSTTNDASSTSEIDNGDTLPTTQAGVVSTLNTSPGAAPGVIQDDAYCAETTAAELVPIKDCLGFVQCQNKKMSGSITLCSPGLIFDANMAICNWSSDTNLCGFEFCPNDMSGYVSFEECTKFYYCKTGKIDGDIDVCPDGTLFDVGMGICNWASMVVCDTKAPTSPPVPDIGPPPASPVPAPNEPLGVVTPRPTYGKVGGGTSTTITSESLSTSSSLASPEMKAEEISLTSSARLRFTPTDDAYVQESQPYANYNDHYIVVDQNARYDGLLRFYVQGLERRKIEYVKLRLYVSNQSTAGGNVYTCKDDWHEDMVTWDSVPSIIGYHPIAVVKAALLDQWIEIDVTGLVQGDGPVSLRITSDSSNNVMYSSKENSNGNSPELIVGVRQADTPTAMLDSLPIVNNTFKIGPSDDAFVFRTTGNKNYGTEIDLKVDMDDGYKKSYMRFDLSRVQIDAVISAKLRLYCTLTSPSGGMFVTVTDSQWDEGSITYNNAPPADGIPLGILDNVEAGNWYELDVTDAINTNGPLTIIILGNHKEKVTYSSKDGPNSPEIVLTLEEFVPLTLQGGGVVELTPTDDATIALQTPNMNFGTNDRLVSDTMDGMHNFLLKFDVTAVPRGQVTSAIVRLYSMNEEPVFGGTFVENKVTQWNEQTVTWDTAPESDGKVIGSLMEVEYGSWYDMDVTSAVIGGAVVSFRISSPHYHSAIYGSKESNYKPQLIVQYSPPDPIPDEFDLYIPTDDTSILMEKPNENYGRIEELKVDGHGGVYNSLLRFDLSSVEKGTVEKAILRIYAVDGSPSGGTFVTTQRSDWTQHQVTWSTAPPADGIILATIGEVVPYQWYEIDLMPIVKEMGGEALSIRIAPSHGLRCAYSSSRDRLGRLPQLLIKADLFTGME